MSKCPTQSICPGTSAALSNMPDLALLSQPRNSERSAQSRPHPATHDRETDAVRCARSNDRRVLIPKATSLGYLAPGVALDGAGVSVSPECIEPPAAASTNGAKYESGYGSVPVNGPKSPE